MEKVTVGQLRWLINHLETIEAYGEIYLNQSKAYTKQIDALANELKRGTRSLRATNKYYVKLYKARKENLDIAKEIILMTRQIDTIFTRIPPTYKQAVYEYIQTGNIKKALLIAKEQCKYVTEKRLWRVYYDFVRNLTATTLINSEKVKELQKNTFKTKATRVTPV